MLQDATGVHVLRHSTKKPGCGVEIMEYFRNAADNKVTKPSHVAVVGDRLFTDILMANMMGSWSIWVKDGVVPQKNLVSMKKAMSKTVDIKTYPAFGLRKPFAKGFIPIQYQTTTTMNRTPRVSHMCEGYLLHTANISEHYKTADEPEV